jgi:hypothetical protein
MVRLFRWSCLVLAFTALQCGGSVRQGQGNVEDPRNACGTEGATVPSTDGCNTCVCTGGSWACTDQACPTTCTPGATRPADDGCNQCSCTDAHRWVCTERACPAPTMCAAFTGTTCAPDQYCAYEPGQYCGGSDAPAPCRPRPQACDAQFAPVCGCDGKTYGNVCQANANGTGVFQLGACETPPLCTNGQTKNDGCNTCVCNGGAWACTARACPVPECKAGEIKMASDGCNKCSCTDAGQWGCTLVACADAGSTKACGAWAGSTCTPSEYCAYQEGGLCGAADAESICKPRPSGCTEEYAPVCGCDRKTYGNACTAATAGTGVYSKGPCN